MNEKKEYTFKLIIVGEPAVGKTSLIKQFVSKQFSNDYRASIGTNIFIKKIQLNPDVLVKIQSWDIAGQEKWTNARHIYYKGTQGIFIVGDLTRKNTFEQIEEFWVPDLKNYNINSPIILLANKNDLNRDISEEEIEILRKKINAEYVINTSAKTGENVDKAFKLISEQIIKSKV